MLDRPLPRLLVALALASPLVAASPSVAAGPRPLASLFPFEAAVTVEGDGPARLSLPAPVLEHCDPDLADLRLFDEGGREVPFLLADRAMLERAFAVRRTIPLELREMRREELRSEDAPPRFREHLELEPIDRPNDEALDGLRWSLQASFGRRSFVREVRVSRASDGFELARGSWFRLPTGATRTTLDLPEWRGEPLAVTIEGEGDGYLAPTLVAEARRELVGSAPEPIALRTLSTNVENGQTRFEIDRPAGAVLLTLELETSSPLFDRAVEVWDVGDGTGERVLLGSGRVLRLGGESAIEVLEVALGPARGSRLVVEITDRDSPPLDDVRWQASGAWPAMLFDLPGTGRAATLRFGGGRARSPDYDLEALRPRIGLGGTRVELASRLVEGGGLARAVLGPVASHPGFDATPPLAFAMRAGAEVDVRRWRRQRRVEVPAAPEGLTHLALDLEDLAAVRADLGDLRIVDAANRQWPFLLERTGARAEAELGVAAPRLGEHGSLWRLALPAIPLVVEQLEIEIDAPFFDRGATLFGTDEQGVERPVTSFRLVRREGDLGPVRIHFQAVRVQDLELRVEDGDDAPLAIERARAFAPPVRALLVAAPGTYRLLLGEPDAEAPRYELARVRDVVLAVRAVDAKVSALAANPDFARVARWRGSIEPGAWLAWIAVGAAVLVLGRLTLSLARRDDERAPPSA